jgi:hypothetical protein
MGRLYTVSFANGTIAASGTLDVFEIRPAANKPVRIHSIRLGQVSQIQDAEEEMIRFTLVRGNTTSGSGGGTPTPIPLDSNDVAAGFGADTMNTTAASAGTVVTLYADTFNVRAGLQLIFTPEERPRVQNAVFIVMRLGAQPAAAATGVNGTMVVEEL